MDPEGFSAMAPQLHRKMGNHARDMKLGELKHLSLSTDTHTVTIFTGSGMTIAVLHQNQSDLGHGVKEKFIAIVDGLAKQYSAGMATH
jgi:predicted regulator of Ras-like GTPase activity (Roadblock/LC7/MglB family)